MRYCPQYAEETCCLDLYLAFYNPALGTISHATHGTDEREQNLRSSLRLYNYQFRLMHSLRTPLLSRAILFSFQEWIHHTNVRVPL